MTPRVIIAGCGEGAERQAVDLLEAGAPFAPRETALDAIEESRRLPVLVR